MSSELPRASEQPGHALWVTPPAPESARLRPWMEALAQDLGGPRFEPHVTVVGLSSWPRERLEETLAATAAGLVPILVATAGPGFQEDYFRALYLSVVTGESLWRAHGATRGVTASHEGGAQGKTVLPPVAFQPHLSLFYGEAPLAERLRALQRCTETLGPLPELRFHAADLALVEVGDGRGGFLPCAEWRVVSRFPLTGADP